MVPAAFRANDQEEKNSAARFSPLLSVSRSKLCQRSWDACSPGASPSPGAASVVPSVDQTKRVKGISGPLSGMQFSMQMKSPATP